MAKKQKPRSRKFPWLPTLLALGVLGVLLTGVSFAFAATQESHDPFCASCHTQPESTFFQRSTAAQAVDLASYHTGQKTRCIDCHSGQGVSGRLSAEMMGANNALKWFSGTATQPAPLKVPIRDDHCLKCHAEIASERCTAKAHFTLPPEFGGGEEEEARTGHWHVFLSRWQSIDRNADGCVDCHPGHSTDGAAQHGFLNANTMARVCNDCHKKVGD